jgi:hypothetical protein
MNSLNYIPGSCICELSSDLVLTDSFRSYCISDIPRGSGCSRTSWEILKQRNSSLYYTCIFCNSASIPQRKSSMRKTWDEKLIMLSVILISVTLPVINEVILPVQGYLSVIEQNRFYHNFVISLHVRLYLKLWK